MLENAVRPKFDQLLFKPLARALVKLRISPLWVTGMATLAGVAVLPLASFGFGAVAVLFLWLSGLFDVLDGAVARLINRATDAGAALDIISDRLVESAVILGLYLGAPEERALLSLLMLSSILLCVTSFLVVGIFSQNDSLKSFHYSPGLMERAEAFCFFSALLLFPQAFSPLSLLFTALVCFTTAVRVYEFLKLRKVFG